MTPLTPAMRKWLERVAEGEQMRPAFDHFRTYDRIMHRLQARGLVEAAGPHGKYRITEAGRAVLKEGES